MGEPFVPTAGSAQGPTIEVSPEAALIMQAIVQRGGEVQIIHALQYTSSVRRQNAKRPAAMVIIIPDEVAKNIKGDPAEQDLIFLVHIPRTVVDEILDPSPIVAPDGGAPAGPRRLIVPG